MGRQAGRHVKRSISSARGGRNSGGWSSGGWCGGGPKFRRLVVWKLMAGERISEGMRCAAWRYSELFLRWPAFAFIRTKPAGVENGIEIEDVMLMEANWALPGCLMVGG